MTGGTASPEEDFQGRYEILGELGAGGFGRVLKARQLSTGQEVAIKVLRVLEGDTAEDQANRLERLRREMHLGATLAHPHIVRLVDSGETPNGQLYAVFDYLPGKTLREVLDSEGALAPTEAVQLLMQVLDAVSCAHAQGIVHRDLKPENIMITRTGTRRHALVLDFGLSGFSRDALDAARTRLTPTGEMLGTPSYAAPEQLRGEPLSPSSDIYSWGLILIECLTGETAISGHTGYEILMSQLGSDPVPIPAELDNERLVRLLRAVTAKDVNERPVSIPPLLEALEEIHRDLVTQPERHATRVAEGDQRPLTVLCCNASVTRGNHFPAELEDLDAGLEELEALSLRLAAEAGGTVVPVQPGILQVVFGYPRVRENDARQAVRMALRLIEHLSELGRDRGLNVRAGIGAHSALGIARPTATPAQKGEVVRYDIVGPSPMLASSLATRAAPGELLITAATRALLREEVECEPAGTMEAPGSEQRLETFRVTRVRRGASLDTFPGRHQTPFTGRAGELTHLLELRRRAEAGESSVVLLQGEAGIGKSRLARELRRRLPPDDSWVGCSCVAEAAGSPLQPVVAWLQSVKEPIDRMLLRLGFDLEEMLPLLASLLDSRVVLPKLSPEQQRELTLTLVTSILLRMARSGVLVLVIEDLHWADPTTLKLVNALIEEVRDFSSEPSGDRPRLLVILTARLEFAPTWEAGEVSVTALGRLSRADVESMIRTELPAGGELPSALVAQIAERTDGVPLFVEEMMHAIRASGGEFDKAIVDRIPQTLQELLRARLDALTPGARETAQVAAALGREFRQDVLAASVERDDWALRQDLVELFEARLIHPRRGGPEQRSVFKHALVRDAAYQSMVRGVRTRVHGRIAAAIVGRFPLLAEQQPEIVALHTEGAGQLADAVEWWQRAGHHAFRHAAYPESAEHFSRAVAALRRLPSDATRLQQEIETLTMLGTAHCSTRGHGDPEVRTTFSRARALCEEHGVEVSLKILAGLIGNCIIEGDREGIESLLPRVEQLADPASDTVTQLTGLVGLSIYSFWRGEHRRAEALLARGRKLYDTDEFRRYAEAYGWDGGIYIYAYSVWNRSLTGDPAGAHAIFETMLDRAQSSVDLQALPIARGFGLAETLLRGDLASTRDMSERLLAVALKQRLNLWIPVAQCTHGLAVALQGEPIPGIDEIRGALDLMRLAGARTFYSYFLTYLATAQLVAAQPDEGLKTVREGLALCARDLACAHEPELLRLEGELLAAKGNLDVAAERLQQALTLAGAREARIMELRAAVSLARVLLAKDAKGASDLLEPICSRFDPSLDLPDLVAARSLLATGHGTAQG